MITVKKVNSFEKIENCWDELYQNNKLLSYYQSTEYMRVSWKNLIPYRIILGIKPVFYVFSKDSQVVFILPLFKRLLKKEYVIYGNKAGFGYLDGMYRDNVSEEDFDECFGVLESKLKGASIEVTNLEEQTPLAKWVLKNGGKISEDGCTHIYFPNNYNDYYLSLSKNMRQNIRTAYNRLDSDGAEVDFASIDYKEMKDTLRYELQRVYVERQMQKYGKTLLFKTFVKYIDLGTKIQKDDGIKEKAFILFVNGDVAAYFDAIYDRERIIIPRLAISCGFQKYSPGVLLINEGIKSLIDEELAYIDLTHGTESYKQSMGGRLCRCIEGKIQY